MFKQKKDYEQKILSLKKRHNLSAEGYRQEIFIKDKEISRLKKEVARLKKKTNLDHSISSKGVLKGMQ